MIKSFVCVCGLLVSLNVVAASLKPVKGKVVDRFNNPLPGATIQVTHSPEKTITDVDGNFNFETIEDAELIVSYIGFRTLKLKTAGENFIHVVLDEDSQLLNDVVVVGYSTNKKVNLSGSVSSLNSEKLASRRVSNVSSALQGMAAGVTVTTQSGEPGGNGGHIRIRGIGTFGGDSAAPLVLVDGVEGTIDEVDPNIIESVSVLKDAASASIYGSRAANGVVVIETVLPKAGKLQLSYNGSANFEIADLSDYNLMNAEEKLEYEVRSGLYEKSSKPGWTDDKLDAYNRILKLVKEGNDVDWLSIPVRELGVGHKHTVMAEGGNESFRYAFDLFYSNKVGVMKGSKRDNYGGGIRLQYNLKNLKFSNYASFDHLKSVNSPYGSFSSYLYYNPYYNPYDENGNVKKVLYSYEYYDRGITSKTMYNELYNAVLPSKNQQTSNNFLNNFSIEYDIIQGLKLKANLSLSVDNGKTDVYKSYENTEFLDKEKKGSYAQSTSNDFSYDINVILSYFKSLKKHFINLGFVYNLQEKQYDNTSIYVVGFPNANMDHVSIGSGYQEGG